MKMSDEKKLHAIKKIREKYENFEEIIIPHLDTIAMAKKLGLGDEY